jgi:uncharacterized cofD-like protein
VEPDLPLQSSPSSLPPPLTAFKEPARRERLVAIGGGTGLPVVLRGLRAGLERGDRALTTPPLDQLTAIVTVTDDGGSSGWVRRELGTLPPGDIRNCLAALADDSPLADLLQHRFNDTRERSGHSVGNLMLAGLAQITGDFAEAVDQMARMLRTRGRVLPSTQESISLRAQFESGDVIEGETAIAHQRRRIRRLSLERPVRPLPEALRALINADGIVIGPGSLYTSVLPNLLVGGIAATLSGVDAVRIYVANVMTEPGETDGFSLDDHLRVLHEHVGMHLFDYVIVNSRPLTPARAALERRAGAEPVIWDGSLPHGGGATVVVADLLSEQPSQVRHSPEDLGATIMSLVRRGRPRRDVSQHR